MALKSIHPGVVCASLLCISSHANAVILGFNEFAAGLIIDDEYAPAVDIIARNFGGGPNAAVIFDTDNPTGGDNDLAAPFSSATPGLSDSYTPGNVLIIQERDNCDFTAGSCTVPDDEGSRPAGEFEFVFNTAVILESLDFFDIEPIESSKAIRLFDVNDDPIFAGSFVVPDTGGDRKWDRLDFSNATGVKRMVIGMGGSGAIDNLSYTVIPVPPAVWLFASGLLGMIGIARRKQRSSPAR